ncbi:high affinity cationic amino acid transporter 1 isoform X2 [Parasteatoda tepidariorum]|uniref:high affinity cationic amino acid transporter 1 isoform X2 n=1 Tax=Parasteatoda tepidariorum TaxID=114398 RepID=UPI001C717DFC|nr:high affinity cationic amino acid transporter 1 isoform X2 [Parasteatoda tepidariorum]
MSWKAVEKSLTRRKFIPAENLVTTRLNRCLNTFDLTFLGVGSTLGLGIYILVGQIASNTAGPAVAVSYLIAAIASVFAALCYAEFGARVPRAGSAYVYSYVTVGEFMAFVIGWNLVLEYVIGTASVARGYSGYIDTIFNGTIARHLNETMPMHLSGLSSFPDFLAFGITLLLTVILAFGVRESSRFNNVCTILNLLVVVYAVICGLFKANLHNWQLTPEEIPDTKYGSGGFFPYGFHGVISGAATCFYGYVGFDCIATTGEEAKNPQKSIPIAIVSSLFIVFCAYFSVSSVQTLMWPYYDQDVPAPLPYVFQMVGYPVAKWVITVGALAGLSTSLLGGMFPLPRIIYAMANDGLIFKFLAKTHEKYKTPLLATFLSGLFTGFMAMIFNVTELANMMSIGTLLAYTLVAVCVLILRYRVDREVLPLSPLGVPGSIEQSSGLENSTLDSTFLADNPYFIREMSKKINYTSSTSTMLASTHHYTFRDYLTQIFNYENIEIQTELSSKVSMMLIYCIGILLVVLDILLTVLDSEIFALDPGALFSVSSIAIIVIIATIALSRQPTDNRSLTFRVPWVPTIPVLSVFVNFNLMLKLPLATWKRFLYWMIAGNEFKQ